MKILTIEEKNYIAGFLDGDGSIFAQIVRGNGLKYKHRIRITIGFYQHKKRIWFLQQLKKKLKCGTIRKKPNDNVVEYVITAANPVKNFLLQIKDSLIIKKRQANLVLEILEKKGDIKSKNEFIKLCILTDKVASLNDSKRKTITAKSVEKVLLEDNSIL